MSGPGEEAEGGDPAEMESPRVMMLLVSGERCGMSSALGCSVPMEVTPVSEALPALERA